MNKLPVWSVLISNVDTQIDLSHWFNLALKGYGKSQGKTAKSVLTVRLHLTGIFPCQIEMPICPKEDHLFQIHIIAMRKIG